MTKESRGDAEVRLRPETEQALHELGVRGREPDQDLWPRIQDELGASGAGARGRWVLLAASLLLAVSLGTLGWWATRPVTSLGSLAVGARSAADFPAASSVELRNALARHLDERADLLSRLSSALEAYPPALRDEVGRNLAVIETAMREIESSLVANSQTDELELAALYDRKLRLLRDLNDRLRGSTPDGE